MSWIQIAVTTSKDHVELTEDGLFSAGAQTVTLTDAEDQPILEPGPDETPVWNQVIITGLFSDDHEVDALLSEINDYLSLSLASTAFECTAQTLAEQNWTRAWMNHFHAMQFGDRLWVCPLHLEPPQPDAINLRLDPGLAFGTGTHPTTSLCLRWLDQNIRQQKDILDYGCGSGILAIAACMLGAGHADGVDIDPQALIATHDNAVTNHVADRVNIWLPEDFQKQHAQTQYDIVIANILSGPLAELAPTLARHCIAGGKLALSGILGEQADSVLEAYNDYFEMNTPEYDEDWVLLSGARKTDI